MWKPYDLQKFKTIRSFQREIYNRNLPVGDTLEQQVRLKGKIIIFKESTKLKKHSKKRKKSTNS